MLEPLTSGAPQRQHPLCVDCHQRMNLIAPHGLHRWVCVPCWHLVWARAVRVIYEVGEGRRRNREELLVVPLPPPRPRYRLPKRPRSPKPRPLPKSFTDPWRAWCVPCKRPMKSVDDLFHLPHWKCARCYTHITKRPWRKDPPNEPAPRRSVVLPLEMVKGLYWIPDDNSPDPLAELLEAEAVEGVYRRVIDELGMTPAAARELVLSHL